jgi:hypothetical protein
VHHDNALAHMSFIVQQLLGFYEDDSHPPLSLLTRSCPLQFFFLFLKMKLKLKGRHFDSSEGIQTKSQDMIKTLTQNNFQQCF